MRLHRPLLIAAIVVALCQCALPVMAEDAPTGRPAVSLSLKPTSSHVSLLLRREDGPAQTQQCDGPCVLDVAPGRYQLGVVDGHGKTDWHSVDVTQPETIELHRSHKALQITGMALFGTGAALAVVGTGAFIYGAVSNLETMECDTASCGGVSAHFIRVSLAGAGIGLVFAAVGGLLAYSASGPTMIEKPGVETATVATKPRALSFALVPDLHAPRAPIASMNLTF